MATGNDPKDLLLMLSQLAQLTQQIDQLSGVLPGATPLIDSPPSEPLATEAVSASSASLVESPPRTLDELLEGLTERIEQFASQSEERARRMEARLERIEKLLEEQAKQGG